MKRILIAEDDKNIATALSIRLAAAGYQVSSAPDGFRSYLRAAGDRPDLILMDITIPITSGLQVSHEPAESGLGDIPVICLRSGVLPSSAAATFPVRFWCAPVLWRFGYGGGPTESATGLAYSKTLACDPQVHGPKALNSPVTNSYDDPDC